MRKSVLASRDGPIDLREIFLLMPDRAEGIVRYYEMVMRKPAGLSPAERELVYAYCSQINGCHFAYTSHSACAVELGISRDVFDALKSGLDGDAIPDRLRPLLVFARKLTLSPGAIEPEDAVPVYEAGWPEAALVSVIEVCALTGFINRVLDGFGAWLPDEKHEANGRALAEGGYLPVARAVRQSIEDASRA